MRYLYYYYTTNRLNFVYHEKEETIHCSYIGYSLKNAIKAFRQFYNLKNKKIKIIKMF